jgi:hypothetical protein
VGQARALQMITNQQTTTINGINFYPRSKRNLMDFRLYGHWPIKSKMHQSGNAPKSEQVKDELYDRLLTGVNII